MSFNYCQREIEEKSKCEEQCEHCKTYYAPLEDVKIFLDDIKQPQECVTYMHTRIGKDNPIYLQEWVVVRNFADFCKAIEKYQSITHVSFDHDLADEHYYDCDKGFCRGDYEEKTGYDCALWMKEYYKKLGLELPIMYVHSMNPVGTQNIINLFK